MRNIEKYKCGYCGTKVEVSFHANTTIAIAKCPNVECKTHRRILDWITEVIELTDYEVNGF